MTRKNEYHWVFGDNVHLHFAGGGNPVLIPPPTNMNTGEGCASISDLSNGNLLFYTDGSQIWDALASQTTPPPPAGLGGDWSATHSAIIVPPAGGGSLYHVFATNKYDVQARAMHHLANSAGQVQSGNGTQISPWDNSERLAATTHADCQKYWVAFHERIGKEFSCALVDADSVPSVFQASRSDASLDGMDFDPRGQMKFSPDGKWLALAYYNNPNDRHDEFRTSIPRVSVYAFDKATGILTRQYIIEEVERPWGIEFSPDSQNLYFTDHQVSISSTRIYGVKISNLSANTPINDPNIKIIDKQNTNNNDGVYSALQLGPNNKIYSTVLAKNWLAEIGDPNNLATPQFTPVMLDPSNQPFEFDKENRSSIPTFTRIADECLIDDDKQDCCKTAIKEVNDELSKDREDDFNSLRACDEEDNGEPIGHICEPADLPDLKPNISITWGSSSCDCLESDDVEIMNITICNPYSNITMNNVIIPKMEVLMKDGSPVPTLPDGTPSVRIIPRGPVCFGDIGGCQCVTREFVMENRGAKSGSNNPYKIEIEKFCFGVSYCNEGQACFEFIICKDN